MKQWGLVAAMVIATGCGRWGIGDDPAPDGDGEVEPPSDAGEIDVVVLVNGTPRQGQSVIFHDADGQVIDVVATGPDGSAAGLVAPNGMVSIVEIHFKYDNIYADIQTIVGVQPGGMVQFGDTYDPWAGGASIDLNYSADVTGATWFGVEGGCGWYTTDLWDDTVEGYEVGNSCTSNGTASFLAGAFDDAENMLAYSFIKQASFDPDDTTVIDMPAWQTSMDSIPVSVSNVPGTDSWVDVHLQPSVGDVPLMQFSSGTNASGSTASTSVDVPSGVADGMATTIIAYSESGSASARYQKSSTAPSSVDVGLDSALPFISSVVLAPGDAQTRPEIAVVGGDLSADAALYYVEWDSVNVSPLGGETNVSWEILARPGAGMPLPALPEFYRNFRPTAADDLSGFYVKAGHLSTSFTDDFDDLRNSFGINIADSYYFPATDYDVSVTFGPSGPPGDFD